MDHKIQDLLELIPKGHWSYQDYKITDPTGQILLLSGDRQPAPQALRSLYSEFFVEMANRIASILWSLDVQTQRTSAALKELKHYQGRSNDVYNEALNDVINLIYARTGLTPSARRELEALVFKVQGLQKNVSTTVSA